MTSLLSAKVVLVTGTASGIGAAIAKLFREHGAKLVMLDREGLLNDELAARLDPTGVNVLSIQVDLRDRNAIDIAIRKANEHFGTLDVLVNNAGIYPRQDFLSMTEAQWDEMQDINLKSMFHTTQLTLPQMCARRFGKIVNISSITFHLGISQLTHYVASKGGVVGLTRALAREVGVYDIHVNCIAPGAVLVEAEKVLVSDDQVRSWVSEQSLQRRILPIDVARVCLFLASELSDGMTGQTLNVDGGWIMH